MAPRISQDRVVQQLSHYVNSQSTDIQNKVRQENKNQQSKENENTEEVNSEETKIYTNDHTSIDSDDGLLGNSITASTEQGIVKPIKVEDIDKEINAITEAIAEISNGIKSVEEAINEELAEIDNKELAESDSGIHDEIYKKKKTKPRWPIVSFDTNYISDRGGNHSMFLTYNRDSNDVGFSKDDDPVIIIKNDAVKNVGGFFKFCSEIEKECEQKISKGEKYYYEDYLKDHGFMKKEEERIAAIKEAKERIAAYMDSYIKKFGGIQK